MNNQTSIQKETKTGFNCQECQVPIKPNQPDEKGRRILEFYGKWTGHGHKLVCQNCLTKK